MIENKELLNSKILIVDDEPSNLLLLERVLANEGYHSIQTTTSPEKSLELYEEIKPDLVLLDLRMPHMDGFEVLSHLWELEKDLYPSVIILTAESDHQIRLNALKAGAKDFLSKPLDLTEVMYRCKNLLEMRILHTRLFDQNIEMEKKVLKRTEDLRSSNDRLIEEINERIGIENLLKKQNKLLESIAQGQSWESFLPVIGQLLETFPHVSYSVLFADIDKNLLKYAYSSGLNEGFIRSLNNISFDEEIACAMAAKSRETVFIKNVIEFPNAKRYQNATEHPLQSVWSTPVIGSEGSLLGAFTVYHGTHQVPSPQDQDLMQTAARLVGIVLERNRAEEKIRSINEQLLNSEKLSAIGKLAASISHEFNNPILGIRNVLEQVARENLEDSSLEELVLLACEECTRVMKLSNRLREFYKPTLGKRARMDLTKAIDDTILLKSNDFKAKGISIEKDYQKDLPPIHAVEDQIRQVILNLLQNAGEAISDSQGHIKVSVRKDGSSLVFQVKDSGTGISKENLIEIFDPFFTTKDEVKGTGLGLSVSYGIVKKHGGHISCTSEPGKGTLFTVILPIDLDLELVNND